MSEHKVDFSAIRGDWHFHMNYLGNAIGRTLARELGYWKNIRGTAIARALEPLVTRQSDAWSRLTSERDAKGSVRVDTSALDEFVSACRDTRGPCDALVDAATAPVQELALRKEFAEACRQLRGLCDDLELMREQKPV